MTTILLAVYFTILALLCVYGLHRLFLVYLFHRCDAIADLPPEPFAELPSVTVQLPLFNERTVVARLLDAVAALDYPADKLEIQVLDDSTDETSDLVAERVAHWRGHGLNMAHIRRSDRTGFKAGALDFGLNQAHGEFVAIFDADFLPPVDFLRRTIDHFTDSSVGMVQARWGHLNREFSRLTRTQAMLLDAHFVVEHFARYRSGRFFNFNGTAGIWRRQCIDDAGGWEHETLTEDLDLSYRAQLRGWRFVFLPEVEAPAELPVEMGAFKSQQYRWTKGSLQVAFKVLPRIWRAAVPLKVKLEATIHLTANLSYLLLLMLALILIPAVYVRAQISGWWELLWIDLPIFFFGTLAVSDFFLTAQRKLNRPLHQRLLDLPMCLAVGMGLSINNARAVMSALVGRESPFVRTPKYNVTDKDRAPTLKVKRYSPNRSVVPYFEVVFGVVFGAASVVAITPAMFALPSLPFLLLFAVGFFYCGLSSLIPMWLDRKLQRRAAVTPQATADKPTTATTTSTSGSPSGSASGAVTAKSAPGLVMLSATATGGSDPNLPSFDERP